MILKRETTRLINYDESREKGLNAKNYFSRIYRTSISIEIFVPSILFNNSGNHLPATFLLFILLLLIVLNNYTRTFESVEK